MDELQDVAVRAARTGAEEALESFRSDVAVEQKTGKTDVVTESDRATQATIVEQLREATPDATIIAEEQASTPAIPEAGQAWIIDPIDGTYNYVRGSPLWSTSLTYLEDARPRVAVTIAPAVGDEYVGVNPPAGPATTRRNGTEVTVSTKTDPETGLITPLAWWPRDKRAQYTGLADGVLTRFNDLRRIGSTQLALASIAAGELDGGLTNRIPAPWDTVAGVALLRWAGGQATAIDGTDWAPTSTGLVVSNGHLQQDVLEVGQAIRTNGGAGTSLEG